MRRFSFTPFPGRFGSFFLIALTAVVVRAETLTYVDLVGRLTDLEHLATLPETGEKCVQWSSWDRRSKYDGASGKYVDWDANGDGGGIIRKEAAIDASNVMLVCQKCGKPSRAGRKVQEDGSKIRVCKKCGQQID